MNATLAPLSESSQLLKAARVVFCVALNLSGDSWDYFTQRGGSRAACLLCGHAGYGSTAKEIGRKSIVVRGVLLHIAIGRIITIGRIIIARRRRNDVRDRI